MRGNSAGCLSLATHGGPDSLPSPRRHFLFKTSSGSTPLFSSSSPGYPLTSGTVYTPPPRLLPRNTFSRKAFKLKKPSKYCSWKCAALSAIAAALLLAILLAYFIGESGQPARRRPGWDRARETRSGKDPLLSVCTTGLFAAERHENEGWTVGDFLPLLKSRFHLRDPKRRFSVVELSILAVFFLGHTLRMVVPANPSLAPKVAF